MKLLEQAVAYQCEKCGYMRVVDNEFEFDQFDEDCACPKCGFMSTEKVDENQKK
jgi:ssDNA-binding Zn-finger/Zn-ribbon topoisomerase 1